MAQRVMLTHISLLLLSLIAVESQITTRSRPQPRLELSSALVSCCRFTEDSHLLVTCVNTSAVANTIRLSTSTEDLVGPTLGIGIVTFATRNIWNYTAFSFAVNEAFAEYNRYVFVMLDPELANYDEGDSRWNKVKILEEAMTGWGRDLDYIMWIDADLVFLDMGLRLEKVAAAYPEAHVIASAEHAGSTTLINSGTVFVRNSLWARTFLRQWWEFANRRLFSDQEQFDMLYESRKQGEGERFLKRVAIIAPDALNTDPPAMTEQKPHNQVLHLMGEQMPFRIRVFRSGFQEICRHVHANINNDNEEEEKKGDNDHDILAPQLTLHRPNLLKWNLEEYSIESEERLATFAVGAKAGAHSMEVMRQLSNSVHHYAHGLEHYAMIQAEKNSPLLQTEKEKLKAQKELARKQQQAISIRIRVYDLLKSNLENKRESVFGYASANKTPQNRVDVSALPRDWPEMVKIVATAGQHLLQTGSVRQRRSLVKELESFLDEMIRSSHHEQHPAIMHMVAHLRSGQGMIELEDNNIEGALKMFQSSLGISQELSVQSGEHILVTPLTMTANALATVGRREEAFQMYAKAVTLTEQQLGGDHDSLAQLLVNFGMALFEHGTYAEANARLQRASAIMTSTNEMVTKYVGTTTHSRCLEYIEKIRMNLSSNFIASSYGTADPVVKKQQLPIRNKNNKRRD